MVRNYKRKTTRQSWEQESMSRAIAAVRERKYSMRAASLKFNVPRATLTRRVENKNVRAVGEKKVLGLCQCIFNPAQEAALVNHIIKMEERFFGMTSDEVRTLAYQLAVKNGIKHGFSDEKQAAGYDWLANFRKRHPELSLRTPEPTSAARARAFNKETVGRFFNILEDTYQKTPYIAHKIFNVDETSITTVPSRNPRILARKGRKQVGTITSAERGESITAVFCVSAAGFYVPPMLIFPRVRMDRSCMKSTPPGSLPHCNNSGWMKIDAFAKWFTHFVKYTHPSESNKILLILDGHSSHSRNLQVLEMARKNHVEILCLPPHCTHRLQPLDVAILEPFDTFYNQSLRRWMVKNPGEVVTLKDIGEIFGEAYLKTSVVTYAINGFEKTGIFPFNPDKFGPADFAPAEVTDQAPPSPEAIPPSPPQFDEASFFGIDSAEQSKPQPQPISPTAGGSSEVAEQPTLQSETLDPLTPTASTSTTNSSSTGSSFPVSSPGSIQPMPKMQRRRQDKQQRTRKAGTSGILTSSPYMQELRLAEAEKQRKLKNKEERQGKLTKKKTDEKKTTDKKKKTNEKTQKGEGKTKKKAAKKKAEAESESSKENCSTVSEDDAACLYCCTLFRATPDEEWIKCLQCGEWAHVECCEEDTDAFVCEMCQ